MIDIARDRSDIQRRKPMPKRATLSDERGDAFSIQEKDRVHLVTKKPQLRDMQSARYAMNLIP